MIGATLFLLMMLSAAQFLVRLYATSVVTSAAYQAAQAVATEGGNPAYAAGAEREARARMGAFGGAHARFVWREADAQQVVLEVIDLSPSFSPLPASYRRIDRTVVVRSELFR